MARPTEYNEEIAARICEQLADGKPMIEICSAEGMPARSTVYKWLAANPGFVAMHQAAREEHADAEFERLDALVNTVLPKDANGRTDMGDVQQLRLKVDTKKWQLARMHPKKYAERFELTGAAGAPLVAGPPTPEQILEGARRIAFMLQKAIVLQEEAPRPPLLLVHDASVKS